MKLTLPQQDVYFEQLMYPDDPIYNIGAKIVIYGEISYELLNQAYVNLINQHDSYRSFVNLTSEGVTFKTYEKCDLLLDFIDFSSFENPDTDANNYMQERFQIPFKLDSNELLHKFILIKVNNTLHYLFSVYHHLITDGWGTSLMFQRLVRNYNEIFEFGKVISQYPYSYNDFVVDDQEYFRSKKFIEDKIYWTKKFENLPEVFLEKNTPNNKYNQSERKATIISRNFYNQLDDIANDLGVTTFHVILGVFFLYFGRKHSIENFAIGLPVLNRGKSVFKKTVGLFMGISPLRIDFNFDENFESLVKKIKDQLRQDYRYQRFPLGKLIKELELFQEKDRLFNLTLSYEKQNYSDHFINTITKVIPLSHQSERVALAIYIREFDSSEDVIIDFDYNVNYFNELEISCLVQHFKTLLTEIISDSKKSLSEYQYLSEFEREKILEHFNESQISFSQNTFLDAFKEQIISNPHKVVLEDEFLKYTYKELDELSDVLAVKLLKFDKSASQNIVAVLMERSANLVLSLLGILKSGYAYLPLDPSFPNDRLEYIIKHSGVKQILSSKNLDNVLNINCEILNIEDLIKENNNYEYTQLKEVSSDSVAYIIYTSGSTGDPKGVSITHKSLLNFLKSMELKPKINSDDYLFSVTTQSFDISILEFLLPLLSGARLYIASHKLLSDPFNIISRLEELRPSVIQATPSFYQMLYNAGWSGDKKLKILCGGDLLSENLSKKLLETNGELWNMYGPTETTIWSSCKKIMQPSEANNIGKPICNTEFYILDKFKELLPVGNIGNIYIGGEGLAKGYYKNEDLTNERFIQSPFHKNKKLYNTGDLGKWNEKGEIEFLGRDDNQVKIRGYRIELGEIETRINHINGVKAVAVVAQKNIEQESRLIAYVVMETSDFESTLIIDILKENLPEYMVPHTIIPLKELPLTPNNKIDRKELSTRKIIFNNEISLDQKPITMLEKELSNYYREVLMIDNEIGISESFFELGGHSLNAVKLINLVKKNLKYKISIKDIFDYPTVSNLSKFLMKKEIEMNGEIVLLEESSYYPITPAQYNIWLASQKESMSIAYNMPALFKVEGRIDKEILTQVFSNLQNKYEVLRTNFYEVDGVPYQKIINQNKLIIEEFFYSENELVDYINKYINKAFDLENENLLRIALFYSNSECSLVFCTHHIIMDGWSLEILIKEFVSNYKTIKTFDKAENSKLRFQFKDYVGWYYKEKERNEINNLNFWERYLKNYQWGNVIPFDKKTIEEVNIGLHEEFIFSSINISELSAFTQLHKISLHSFLVGAFNMLVHKMYLNKDFCIGTVNSGRLNFELHEQLGMFVKTLPFRSIISSNKTCIEILKQTHLNLLLLDEHQDLPDSIQNSLRLDVLIVLQNPSVDFDNIKIDDTLSLKTCFADLGYSRLPLLINFSGYNENISGTISFNAIKYEKETIELIKLKFEKILGEILKNYNKSISSLDLELALEKEKTIDIEFNF